VVTFFKKYWDIIGGIVAGVSLAAAADFELGVVQLCYSVIILCIVCIGIFRLIKQEADKQRKNERKRNVIDNVVDGQKPIRAINLAQSPDKEGEKIGRKILSLIKELKPIMEKFKIFFDKFKGYMLTFALAVLSIVEMCGGFINTACGGMFTILGVPVLPIVAGVASAVAGVISNGFTKEQKEKIKALFSKSTADEILSDRLKKIYKEKMAQLAQFNKALNTQEHERANIESELETLNNDLFAKKEMFAMNPQLVTREEVLLAENAVGECKARHATKVSEIAKTKESIENLGKMIADLKSKL
jgi:hypothetical protein